MTRLRVFTQVKPAAGAGGDAGAGAGSGSGSAAAGAGGDKPAEGGASAKPVPMDTTGDEEVCFRAVPMASLTQSWCFLQLDPEMRRIVEESRKRKAEEAAAAARKAGKDQADVCCSAPLSLPCPLRSRWLLSGGCGQEESGGHDARGKDGVAQEPQGRGQGAQGG